MTRCPGCGHLVVFNAGGGKLKVRTSMVLLKKGEKVTVLCHKCGVEVPMDLLMGDELLKALADDRRLVIRPDKKSP